MGGWIKIHTKLLEWEWASCPETMALWLHILLNANYEDKRWRGTVIPRGSFVTSISSLSSSSGLSVKQVRTSLQRLVSTNEIVLKATNKNTMISVCKYDTYQVVESEEGKQGANEGQTKGKQRATTKELKTLEKESISKDIPKKEDSFDALEVEISKAVCRKPTLDLSFVRDDLKDVFLEFLNMRKKIGKALKTPTGIKMRYEKLITLSNGDKEMAIKIARQSIEHEWQDFYELKEDKPTRTSNSKQLEYTNDKYW